MCLRHWNTTTTKVTTTQVGEPHSHNNDLVSTFGTCRATATITPTSQNSTTSATSTVSQLDTMEQLVADILSEMSSLKTNLTQQMEDMLSKFQQFLDQANLTKPADSMGRESGVTIRLPTRAGEDQPPSPPHLRRSLSPFAASGKRSFAHPLALSPPPRRHNKSG